jgi:hypothetical protein
MSTHHSLTVLSALRSGKVAGRSVAGQSSKDARSRIGMMKTAVCRRIRRQGPRIIRSLLAHESVLTQNDDPGPWIGRPSQFQETRRDSQEYVA